MNTSNNRPHERLSDYMRQRTDIVTQSPGAWLDGCHEWRGTIANTGYGLVGLSTHHLMLAHRVAYELSKGPIPAGLVIDHLCHNRSCVNPDHLEAVTRGENNRRGDASTILRGIRSACINGHEYTPENTLFTTTRGIRRRACKQCRRASAKRFRDRARENNQRSNS